MTATIERRRRRQQREQSRAEVLAAADRFLRERPFRELTVDRLMAETGLGRTVFYRHFADVHDLVTQLFQELGADLLETTRGWAQSVGEPDAAAARERLDRAVGFFARNGPLVQAIADAAASDEELEQIYRGFLDRFTDVTAEGLQRLLDERRIAPLEAGGTARALTLMNERYLLDAFGRGADADPERVASTLWTVWWRTIYGIQESP